MLSITGKPAHLGTHLSARVQYAGDNKTTAVDFSISGIMLESHELNDFLGDPQAHSKLFSAPHVGALFQPSMTMLSTLPVKEKLEKVFVELMLTDELTIRLARADLARITLVREVGGLTNMSCQVQALPNLDDPSIAQLLKRLDTDIDVSIGAAQGELGLEDGAGDPNNTQGNLADAAAAEAQHPEESEV